MPCRARRGAESVAGLTDGAGLCKMWYVRDRLSGAGSLFHVVLVKRHTSPRFRRTVPSYGRYRVTSLLQPADNAPQLRSVEHPNRCLHRQMAAFHEVREDFSLGIPCHILVLLIVKKARAEAPQLTNLPKQQ